MHGDLYLFNLITSNLIQLFNSLILASSRFSQHVSSLNCVQLLPSYKVQNPPGQVKLQDTFYIQLFIYILYVFCTQIVYIVFTMCTFCRSELMYPKCIQDVHKMYPIFWKTFVYILYTNLNYHSSFNFAYKMYIKVCWNVGYTLYASCIHFLYISCIHLVQFLYTKCTHDFCAR